MFGCRRGRGHLLFFLCFPLDHVNEFALVAAFCVITVYNCSIIVLVCDVVGGSAVMNFVDAAIFMIMIVYAAAA